MSFSEKPTIVVPAYNRPASLQRLLDSLQQANYPSNVRLVISLDSGGKNQAEVKEVADQFHWAHGKKELIHHSERLGLIGNVFFCGGLAKKYGAIILLEDDLVVSRAFYQYAQQAMNFYGADERIAGISLNALWFNGYTHQPFIPYLDNSDVFFLPIAWYHGQLYTAEQWTAFEQWQQTASWQITSHDHLHEMFQKFPRTDWFPFKTKYLVQTGRYYLFPRESLTSNYGDEGTHFRYSTRFFQLPRQHFRQQFRFLPLDEAVAVYDSFFEMQPERLNRLAPFLADFVYEVDLYGTKSLANIRQPYVLTTKLCRQAIRCFGQVLYPMEENVIMESAGTAISLCRREQLKFSFLALLAMRKNNWFYFRREHRGEWRQQIIFALLDRLFK